MLFPDSFPYHERDDSIWNSSTNAALHANANAWLFTSAIHFVPDLMPSKTMMAFLFNIHVAACDERETCELFRLLLFESIQSLVM